MMEYALKEKEGMLRAVLCANKTASIDEIKDPEMYKVALEVTDQVDALKDLVEELKSQIKTFGAFKYL